MGFQKLVLMVGGQWDCTIVVWKAGYKTIHNEMLTVMATNGGQCVWHSQVCVGGVAWHCMVLVWWGIGGGW